MKRNGLGLELAGSTVGLHNSRCGNKDNSSSQLPLGAFRRRYVCYDILGMSLMEIA